MIGSLYDEAFCRTAVRLGLITQAQVEDTLRQKGPDAPVSQHLLRNGLLTEEQAARVRQEITDLTEVRTPTPGPRATGTRTRSNLIGQTLGGCLLVQQIGQGGMGTVFKATHLGLEKTVAVKILSEQITGDPESIDRFMREARILARVEHLNIVSVHHVGEETGVHFIVMQFLEGKSLEERIREGPMDPAEAARITRDVARGLGAAHRAGIIHRDLKPHNVILTTGGIPKVVDFGLARDKIGDDRAITRPGSIVGSPLYMAPEQCAGQPTDGRTDLYALGCTLHHMLTGRPPYLADTLYEICRRHVNAPVPDPRTTRPDVPEPLALIAKRLMAKNPADRYPDAGTLIRDLERFLGGETVQTGVRRARILPWALLAAAVLGALSAMLFWPAGQTPVGPRPLATRPQTRLSVVAPAGTRITIQGETGTAYDGPPGTVPLSAGRYGVVAVLGPCRRVEAVVVVEGRESSLAIDPGEPVGSVRLASKPPGAVIEIDGVPCGVTPQTVPNLELRKHTLKLSAEGHVPAERPFSLESRGTVELSDIELLPFARLTPTAVAFGRKVRLEGFTVLVDGERVDPGGPLRVAPGRRRLRIEHPQVKPADVEVETEPGKEARPRIELEAKSPWEDMVLVPPGSYVCGEKKELVRLRPFYIDAYEVTQREYAEYMTHSGAPRPRVWTDGGDDLPVRSVTWKQADDYATYRMKRLPTAEEWEVAAGGEQGRLYPWGNQWDAGRANTREAGTKSPVPVPETRKDASPFGCFGMAGNLREWTSTKSGEGFLLVKGASYDDNEWFARAHASRHVAAIDSSATNGLRCAADFLKDLFLED